MYVILPLLDDELIHTVHYKRVKHLLGEYYIYDYCIWLLYHYGLEYSPPHNVVEQHLNRVISNIPHDEIIILTHHDHLTNPVFQYIHHEVVNDAVHLVRYIERYLRQIPTLTDLIRYAITRQVQPTVVIDNHHYVKRCFIVKIPT